MSLPEEPLTFQINLNRYASFGLCEVNKRWRKFARLLTIILVTILWLPEIILGAQSFSYDCMVFEDFSISNLGEFPNGWSPRTETGRSVYSVHLESGQRFLRAKAVNSGIEADKKRDWDLGQYPILTWKWRPREFPRGANEQHGKNDSVLGVYVGFSLLTGSLKYIWSESVPVGTEIDTGLFGRTKMKVVNSGVSADKESWRSEERRVGKECRL